MNKCKWIKMVDVSKTNYETTYQVECKQERFKVQSIVVSNPKLPYSKPFQYCPYCSEPILFD